MTLLFSENEDFVPISQRRITFTKDSSSVQFNVSIVDNRIVESNEVFQVSFTIPNESMEFAKTTESESVATISITDDDDDGKICYRLCAIFLCIIYSHINCDCLQGAH